MAPVRLGFRVGPRQVGWRVRPFGYGWGWGGRRRGFGVFGLFVGLLVLGVLAFFVCSIFGFLAFRR